MNILALNIFCWRGSLFVLCGVHPAGLAHNVFHLHGIAEFSLNILGLRGTFTKIGEVITACLACIWVDCQSMVPFWRLMLARLAVDVFCLRGVFTVLD